jgi:hypothetical protein
MSHVARGVQRLPEDQMELVEMSKQNRVGRGVGTIQHTVELPKENLPKVAVARAPVVRDRDRTFAPLWGFLKPRSVSRAVPLCLVCV